MLRNNLDDEDGGTLLLALLGETPCFRVPTGMRAGGVELETDFPVKSHAQDVWSWK